MVGASSSHNLGLRAREYEHQTRAFKFRADSEASRPGASFRQAPPSPKPLPIDETRSTAATARRAEHDARSPLAWGQWGGAGGASAWRWTITWSLAVVIPSEPSRTHSMPWPTAGGFTPPASAIGCGLRALAAIHVHRDRGRRARPVAGRGRPPRLRPESPPDRAYYFQYGWVLPGIGAQVFGASGRCESDSFPLLAHGCD
jgi:hypothetical protein